MSTRTWRRHESRGEEAGEDLWQVLMKSEDYSLCDDEDLKDKTEKKRREMCSAGCERPTSVCICSHLPSSPLPTSATVFVLQHPHELRHKLATAPLLPKCLLSCHTATSRRLRSGTSPFLDSLLASPPSIRPEFLFLFPGTPSHPSIPLHDWVASRQNPSREIVLIVFDGTWKHAREMVEASLPFLSEIATRVSLDFDVEVEGASAFESDLVLRKEPFQGCMSTIEAVARSLGVLERDGPAIEERLISILRAIARFQSENFKPVKPRVRLGKKGKVPKIPFAPDSLVVAGGTVGCTPSVL